MSLQDKFRHQHQAQQLSKTEKFNQEILKLQQRNNGKLFMVQQVQHSTPPLSPFYVPPSHSFLNTHDIFGNHIRPASLSGLSHGMLNELMCGGGLPPTFLGQSPALLFDKARGQLMTTLNMHPVQKIRPQPSSGNGDGSSPSPGRRFEIDGSFTLHNHTYKHQLGQLSAHF